MDKKLHQEIINDDDLTLTEKIDAVFAALPPNTSGSQAARDAEIDEQFYDEFAQETILGVSTILSKWVEATKQTCGEDSAEYQKAKADTAPIQERLKSYGENTQNPTVRAAIQPLREIWKEYRGWNYNDNGGISKTDNKPSPEVVSSIGSAASLDL